MKLLVFGVGVLGSLYAAKLRRAGHMVAVLARGQRALDLQTHGIVLEHATTGAREATPVTVLEQLDPADAYDFILVLASRPTTQRRASCSWSITPSGRLS